MAAATDVQPPNTVAADVSCTVVFPVGGALGVTAAEAAEAALVPAGLVAVTRNV